MLQTQIICREQTALILAVKKPSFKIQEEIWGAVADAVTGTNLSTLVIIDRARNPRSRINPDKVRQKISEAKIDELSRLAKAIEERPSVSVHEIVEGLKTAAARLKE